MTWWTFVSSTTCTATSTRRFWSDSVHADLSCTPTTEVMLLEIAHAGVGQYTWFWSPVVDPCLEQYALLGLIGSAFEPVVTTGTTSFTGNLSPVYYLLVAVGGSGQQGPTGH